MSEYVKKTEKFAIPFQHGDFVHAPVVDITYSTNGKWGFARPAMVAKAIRALFRSYAIPFESIESKSYSMGSSVTVTLPKETEKEKIELAEKIVESFEYGRYDAENDISYIEKERIVKTEDGFDLSLGVKYGFVNISR